MRKVLVLGLLVALLATIASIVSTAIPYWLYLHGTFLGQEGTVNIGLWRSCISYKTVLGSGSMCGDSGVDTDWWKAVEALMILGNVALVLSTVLGCLYFKFSRPGFVQGAVFLALVGGTILIIAVIVFGVEEKENRSSFSASFILATISGVMAYVAAGLIGVAKRENSGYSSI